VIWLYIFGYFALLLFLSCLALFAVTVTWVKVVLWLIVAAMILVVVILWWLASLW
jgi:hypothetical protein